MGWSVNHPSRSRVTTCLGFVSHCFRYGDPAESERGAWPGRSLDRLSQIREWLQGGAEPAGPERDTGRSLCIEGRLVTSSSVLKAPGNAANVKKLTFHGATGTVTGSKYLIDDGQAQTLVDSHRVHELDNAPLKQALTPIHHYTSAHSRIGTGLLAAKADWVMAASGPGLSDEHGSIGDAIGGVAVDRGTKRD